MAQQIAQHRHRRGCDQRRVGAQGRVVIAREQDQPAHRRRVGEGERQCGVAAPGVADHNRRGDAEAREGAAEKVGLVHSGPRRAPWSVAVPVARAVEGDRPVPALGEAVEHAAEHPVLDGDDVAVEQDDRRAGAPVRPGGRESCCGGPRQPAPPRWPGPRRLASAPGRPGSPPPGMRERPSSSPPDAEGAGDAHPAPRSVRSPCRPHRRGGLLVTIAAIPVPSGAGNRGRANRPVPGGSPRCSMSPGRPGGLRP